MDTYLCRTKLPLAGGLRLERLRSIKRGLLRILLIVLAVGGGRCEAQERIDPEREANVKAVFLYSFGRFVAWPEVEEGTKGRNIDNDFVVALLGESRVFDKLQRIAATRKIAGRDLRLVQVASLKEIPPCHILFVAGALDESHQKALLQETIGKPILVVGESLGFANRGAAINFYVLGANVRFQINAEAVHQHGLQLDAKLLNLGDRIGGPSVNR